MRARFAPQEFPTHSTSPFLSTHPARSLRPGQRIVEVGLIIGLVKLALFRGETIDLLPDGRELDLLRLAGCTLALADEIEGHFRPPAVAVAVAGRAIGQSRRTRWCFA